MYQRLPFPKKTDKKDLGSFGVDIFVGGIFIQPGNWVYIDSNGWVISNNELVL